MNGLETAWRFCTGEEYRDGSDVFCGGRGILVFVFPLKRESVLRITRLNFLTAERTQTVESSADKSPRK